MERQVLEKIVDDLSEIESRMGDRLASIEVEISQTTWYEILKRMHVQHYPKEMIEPTEIMGKHMVVNQNMDNPFAFRVRLKERANG